MSSVLIGVCSLVVVSTAGCASVWLSSDMRPMLERMEHVDFPGVNLADPTRTHPAELWDRLDRDVAGCPIRYGPWQGWARTRDAAWVPFAACLRSRGWRW
jgi:hypothetical protein